MTWSYVGQLAFMPAPDPLWLRTPTPLTQSYNVLGITLAYSTNAPILAALADEVFGDWGRPNPREETPVVTLQAVLHDVEEPKEPMPPLLCRAHGGTLLLSRGASMGFGSRPEGAAAAFVTQRMMSDPETVRTCFLECLGLFVVCRHRRATLHAAAVVHNERCLLITGESGAGKSTLAYACLRAGFRLLSEDIVFVEEKDRAMDAWGNPWTLNLLPDTVRFFPELSAAPAHVQMNGERKLRTSVKGMDENAPVTHARIWGVCSLSRSPDGISRLAAPNADCLRHALTHFKEDPMLDRAAIAAAAGRLIQGRAAHLEIGDSPIAAAEILRRWMEAD